MKESYLCLELYVKIVGFYLKIQQILITTAGLGALGMKSSCPIGQSVQAPAVQARPWYTWAPAKGFCFLPGSTVLLSIVSS